MPDRDLARALADFVGRQVAARQVEVLEFSRLSGGSIQDNHGLTLELHDGVRPGRMELVVRSDAPSRVAASLSRPQEFEVLVVAHEAGVLVPRPLWLCTDRSVMGAEFYIMERAAGSASPRHWLGEHLGGEQARALTHRLGAELARLHKVRPPHERLAFLSVPAGSPALARVQHYRQALACIPEPHPVLEWGLNWLADHAPETEGPVLCHCDFRSGNYMVDQGELSAILDWEFAAWGDPYEDIGWLCSPSWRFGRRDHEVGGLGHKPDLFRGYSSVSGKPVDAAKVSYWEVMATARWAIIALQQAQRHLSGEQQSLELALTGRLLPQIEYDLLAQVEEIGGVS